jgi:ABC-2 type transport system ATP-binding protein
MIEVNDLVKIYGTFPAVKGISFRAEPGQVTGFLGPNGAGKTTTMRILTGYAPPTSGSATVAGFDVFNQSMEVRKHVGYLPENVPLYRDMSALGYLMYLAEIRGVRNRRARAQDVLDRVGLGSRANSLIRTLSKGMRQRVGLAAALVHDPKVLILDEPTIGLDPIQVLELRDLIAELGKEHTVLFSTHILSEAEQVCDRVVIINQGEIIAEGTPNELREEIQRGSRIAVRTVEPAEKALAVVQKISSITDAYADRDLVMASPANSLQDPRPEITRALVNAGLHVLEVRPAANNLEEIFLELTRRAMVVEAEGIDAPVTEESEA